MLVEMVFVGYCGINVDIVFLGDDCLVVLFNEELGVVIQVCVVDCEVVEFVLVQYGFVDCVYYVGQVVFGDCFVIIVNGQIVFSESCIMLCVWWVEIIWQMQCLCDNLECVDQEYQVKFNDVDFGLNVKLLFDINEDVVVLYIVIGVCLKVVVLCEQGVNLYVEMVVVFYCVGFDVIDVYMSDLLIGCMGLEDFYVLVVCGGFFYGDVLGVGEGWVKLILFNDCVCDEFVIFFYCL